MRAKARMPPTNGDRERGKGVIYSIQCLHSVVSGQGNATIQDNPPPDSVSQRAWSHGVMDMDYVMSCSVTGSTPWEEFLCHSRNQPPLLLLSVHALGWQLPKKKKERKKRMVKTHRGTWHAWQKYCLNGRDWIKPWFPYSEDEWGLICLNEFGASWLFVMVVK